MGYCKYCGKPMDDGAAFCPNCGNQNTAQGNMRENAQACTVCGAQIKPGQLFCDNCGTAYQPNINAQQQMQPSVNSSVQYQQTDTSGLGSSSFKPSGMGLLYVATVFAVLFCWPAAIYGIYCIIKAPKAVTKEEGDAMVRKGTKTCFIAGGIVLVILLIL